MWHTKKSHTTITGKAKISGAIAVPHVVQDGAPKGEHEINAEEGANKASGVGCPAAVGARPLSENQPSCLAMRSISSGVVIPCSTLRTPSMARVFMPLAMAAART